MAVAPAGAIQRHCLYLRSLSGDRERETVSVQHAFRPSEAPREPARLWRNALAPFSALVAYTFVRSEAIAWAPLRLPVEPIGPASSSFLLFPLQPRDTHPHQSHGPLLVLRTPQEEAGLVP